VELYFAYVARSSLTAIFLNSSPQPSRVKTFALRLVLFLAAVAGALGANVRTSLAYQLGDSRWCAVVNKGADVLGWDCEYDSSDECAAAIAGTGGFCAVNPYWRPDPSSNGH
jgi:hypothetical protein